MKALSLFFLSKSTLLHHSQLHSQTGTLGNFDSKVRGESDGQTKNPSSNKSRRGSNHDDDSIGAAILGGIMGGIFQSAFGGVNLELREFGDPLVPYLQFDLNDQNVASDIYALNGRAEVGFSSFGAF